MCILLIKFKNEEIVVEGLSGAEPGTAVSECDFQTAISQYIGRH